MNEITEAAPVTEEAPAADTIRVVVIPDDESLPVTVQELAREDGSTLRALQAAVGGMVDVVRLTAGVDMWVDDEGLLKERPFNVRATAVGHTTKWAIASGEYPAPVGMSQRGAAEDAILARRHIRLVGTAVIAGEDGDGDTVSVPDRMVAFLRDEMGLIE